MSEKKSKALNQKHLVDGKKLQLETSRSSGDDV